MLSKNRNMETIFTNPENSKTNEPRKFRLSLADKLKLKTQKQKYDIS